MAPSFEKILEKLALIPWSFSPIKVQSFYGNRQYFGPHFVAALRYALKLGANNNHGFTIIEELASETNEEKISGFMASSLPYIKELFEVEKLHTDIDYLASFIGFLVDVLEALSSHSISWVVIPDQINIIHQRLNFLLYIIRETTILCAKPEERNNISAEIKYAAHRAGEFIYSSFFTTTRVVSTRMNAMLRYILRQLKRNDETIMKHFEMILEQPGAAFRFALKLSTNNNDGFTIHEKLAHLNLEMGVEWVWNEEKVLNVLAPFLAYIREIFPLPKQHKYLSDINSNTVDSVASFIEFLVDTLERLLKRSPPWIGEINILRLRLNFLLVILRDTPFKCAEPEERKNILAQIESSANEAGKFISSSFCTANRVSSTEMDLELYLLLSKLEAVEETIKKHFEMILEHSEVTTSNLTSTNTYIVDSLLDDLNHLLNHRADLVHQVKDQITTLHEGLYSCRLMLRDIELPLNEELTKYEMQFIDLAYQAEYIIACFVAGEVSVWYLTFRLQSFIRKSNPIRASLTKFKTDSSLGCVRITKSSIEVSSSQVAAKSIPMSTAEIIVGFRETRGQIASYLVGGPNHLQIIAIIGMGGSGKTTITRNLYNDSQIRLHFDRRSWCVVSQTCQKRNLLIDILSSLSDLNKDAISSMEDYQLAECLYKSLKGTRYLLVMDDIWKYEVWDDLKRYFPDDRNRSRIIFTSRNKDVVLQGLYEPIIHDLPSLSPHECWDLLQKKVFSDSVFPQELQDVGKEIARHCKGLPLAVVGIAAVLANKDKKKSLWQEVATNLRSYILKDQDILELSYSHLPSHLKPCFLFLGVFEEDKEVAVRELLYLWVSEGLIPKNEYISEDIAENYLVELINRNMVQVSKRRSDNGVKTFTMHDLMRDMCLRIGDREKIVKVINKESSTCEQHHHICINTRSYDFTSTQVGLHIRSLFWDFEDLTPITSNMKRLRVLKLSEDSGKYPCSTLEFLVQLRHLECAGAVLDFETHTNLEFLSIKNPSCKDIQLNMPKLRHLHLGRLAFPLKYLHLSQANSLQTLSYVSIENYEDGERLRCFSNLHRLKCEYGKSWIMGFPDLSSLTQLVSLNIGGRGGYKILFRAINFPTHIKKLSISWMCLNFGLLSSIGTLPHLEIFKLKHVHFEGCLWNTNDDEFKTLKFLKIELTTLQDWNIASEDHFPVLEQLVLRGCLYLKHLPSDLGYIPTLHRIEVLNCTENVRKSAKNIQEEQEEAGNEQLQVIINP